ncbi:MAG: hypothetical protein HXY18_02435 [Bryobacteraceae bacterium]|nr:hypothetical protein [Bryobacteraceae bacterium]
MFKAQSRLCVILALLVAAPLAAAPLVGSFGLSPTGAAINGTDMSDSTIFTPVSAVFPTAQTGDYILLPTGSIGVGGAIFTANMASFSVNYAGFGEFSATSGLILVQTPSVLRVLYSGIFTPEIGGPIASAGFDPTPASVLVNLTQVGPGAASYEGVLSSPPAEIPEPGSFALAGAAIWGLVILRTRANARARQAR